MPRPKTQRFSNRNVVVLIAAKREGERVVLSTSVAERWQLRLDEIFSRLKRAHDESPLPEQAPNADELEKWLIAQRLAKLPQQPT